MTYSAVDDVGDAYEATKALLLPFDLRRWLALAVVVFFVSGTTGFDPNSNLGVVDLPGPTGPSPDAVVADPAFVLLAGGAALVALAAAFVAAVMEFVFVRIAHRRDVRVAEYFRRNVSKGLSLFVLRLLLGLFALASVLFVLALAIGGGVASLAVIVLLSPLIVLALVALYVFHRFTVDFVVPVMLVADVGVLEGWRRFLPEVRSEPREYGVYALVRVGLGIGAAVVAGIGFTMVAVVVGIPFAIVGATVYAVGAVLGAGAPAGYALWAVAALYAIAVAVAGVTLVQVPVSTYLRYYSLLVLADVSPRYDLVSDDGSHAGTGGPPAPGGDGDGDGGASDEADAEGAETEGTGDSTPEGASTDENRDGPGEPDADERHAEDAFETVTEEPERYDLDEDERER